MGADYVWIVWVHRRAFIVIVIVKKLIAISRLLTNIVIVVISTKN